MTPEQIKERGFAPIESGKDGLRQLEHLPAGRFEFLDENGKVHPYHHVYRPQDPRHPWHNEVQDVYAGAGFLKEFMVGFKPIPEPVDTTPATASSGIGSVYAAAVKVAQNIVNDVAASVADTVTDGFEKKTEFYGCSLDELTDPFSEADPSNRERELAGEVCCAYTHIDAQAATIAAQQQEIERQAKELKAYHELKVAYGNVFSDRDREIEQLKARLAELEQLRAAREWKPIESAEQLDAEPAGCFEFVSRSNISKCASVQKFGNKWWVAGHGYPCDVPDLLEKYSHYRLLTAASDFTPPTPKTFQWGDTSYTREELPPGVIEQARAIVEATKEKVQ